MRRIVHIGAVVATTAAVIPALAAFNPAQAPAPADPGGGGSATAPLIVEEITPKSIGRGSTVRITGQVVNTTGSALRDVSVRFSYASSPVTERSELDSFSSGEGEPPDTEAAEVALDGTLEPGESAGYTLRADASDLSLSSWGVYPAAVQAFDGSGDSIGAERTFLPYRSGDGAPESVRIAWVWPLMDRPQRADDDTYLDTSLVQSLGSDGRLGQLLTTGAQSDDVTLEPGAPAEETAPSPSTAATPSASADGPDSAADAAGGGRDSAEDSGSDVPVTWAVDPGLLADIERLTSPYRVTDDPQAVAEAATGGGTSESDTATTSKEPSPEARLWLEQARAALADDSVVSTPYASADIAALLRHGLSEDADASVSLGRETVERVLERSTDETVALPEGGLMNTATREFYQRQGAGTFLLRDDAMPAQSWVEHTPTAQAPLSLGKGEEGTALVADSSLTDVVSRDASGPGEAALAQQRFAAETAMIAGEDAATKRTLVAYPASGWNPGSEYAAGMLEASGSLPWLQAVDLSDVKPSGPEAGDERENLTYPKRGTRAELGKGYLSEIKDLRGRVRLFNSILVDGEDPFRPAVLRLESAAWRHERELARPAHALVEQAVERDMDKVHLLPTEPVTLASATGTIGVLIANDLDDHTVRVNLSLLSENPERLSIGNYEDAIEIGPGQKTTVYVELSTRVNGRTMIQMNLHNLSGEPVSEEQVLAVNATGMGSQALVISGLGALVLVVALAPRALRKWARNRARRYAAADAASAGEETGGDGEASADGSGVQDNEDESARPAPAGSDTGSASSAQTGEDEGEDDDESGPGGTPTGR
ncbi:DUF6049 family protein [Streptomonospora wellingtoniae]|uniref:DUF6049 family protein n=1 Tax=Streptomonospora wellingtoniae TaxID=3075544 RepID=A0ABU2KRR2_9ACTN|nr:DUF6049 family protein [Streptomonospora sp. DSM 45055]MDT0301981.1 DUF6049 family protein [Streptomonospora sp. DSM 45055]